MSDALADVTAVDVTEGYASYAGKLLSDLGADVIKVERPGGDPARAVGPFAGEDGPDASAFFGFLNTGKRGVVLNPARADDRAALERLAEGADVVFEDFLPAYGLDPASLGGGTVAVSITGFGREGPYAGFESVDLIETAMSGMAYQSGYPDRPPTRPPVSASSYFGATYAAVGALLALRARGAVGGQHVDVSKQEATAANIESRSADYAYNGEIQPRGRNTSGIYPVEDGYVTVLFGGSVVEGPMGGRDFAMWPKFCRAVGREDLLADERFNALPDDDVPGTYKRRRNAEAFGEVMREELADWTAEELYHEMQEAGVVASVVSTAADLFENPQLEARGFLSPLALPDGETVTAPGAPYLLSGKSVEPERAPRLDEHGEEVLAGLDDGSDAGSAPTPDGSDPPDGALDGVRVLDFTAVWAGPSCTKLLADHGADVIKVESKQYVDLVRGLGPFYKGDQGAPEHGEDRSGYYQTENRSKRAIAVDLGTDEGVDLVREIVAEGGVDVVVESFAPGVMGRLGLGYETLREGREDLVMCSLSGYGQEGPDSDYRAYGPSLEPHSGITYLNGFPGDDPVRTGISFTDPVAGLHGAYAIAAALHRRDRTGEGCYVDLSQMEVGATITHAALSTYDIEGEVMGRIGNRDERGRIVQGVYPCAETEEGIEEWVAIAIRGERDWAALAEVVDADWTGEERFATQERRLEHHDALDERLGEWTAGRERYAAMDRLQGAGVPAGVVQTTKDLLERDRALDERGFWERTDHPVIGEQPYPGALPPLSATPGRIRGYAPMLGQHTREVLYGVLGVDGERVADLEEGGVLE